jgi:thiol-disulfide isomerase/thioredoxin
MKNLILFLLISGILFSSCSKSRDIIPSITFNDSSYIKIIAKDNFDSLVITTRYSSHFPHQPCIYHQKIIKEKGVYKVGYRILKPELVEIAVQDTFYSYMLPADTLVIQVGIDSSELNKPSVYYKIEDPIYTYFKAEKEKFGTYYFYSPIAFQSFNNWPESQKDFDEAVRRINSWRNDRLAFLEKNKHTLPKWFVNIQQADYVYYAAGLKFYQYFHLQNDKLAELPPTDVKIYNPEAKYSCFYWAYISDYFILSDTVDNHLAGAQRMVALYEKASPKINSVLKGDILRYFNAFFLLSLNLSSQSKDDIELVEQFTKTNDFGLNESEIAFTNQARSDKKEAIETMNKNRLLAGEKAQSFHLKDISDNLHTLVEFKGKIVYLHFWATWCGPCLKELPRINELSQKIGNKPIVIVNVCMDDNPDGWKEIIKKEKLKGINLICQGKWSDLLKNSYSIIGVPHYALIDKNGLLIANACGRPDEIYDDLLKNLRDD